MTKKLFLLIGVLIIGASFNTSHATILILPTSASSRILPTDPDPAKVKAAMEEFRSLSKKEKRERIRETKNEIKIFNASKKAGKEPSTSTLLLVILAILLPPLAVYLHEGVINKKFWIDLVLTLLFYLPGMIYALVVVLGKD